MSAHEPAPSPSISLRALLPGVYLPTLLFEIGVGAMMPMIAVSTTSLGGSLSTAALMVSLLAVGKILADVPAGALAAKVGDRPAMVAASGLAVLALAGLALAPNLATLAVGVLLVGACEAVYGLARQSYLTAVIHPLRRARALSTLGGVARIGLFLGPFVGALVMAGSEEPSRSYWVGVVTSLAAAAVVVGVRDPAKNLAHAGPSAGARPAVLAVLREHRRVFLTLGVAVLGVSAVRGARNTVLPVWTESLGFDPSTTSLVFGLSGAIDMLLFYPAGKVMDRFGRLWVAIPSMAVMGVAMLVLPLTSTLVGVSVVAMVLGLGNGIGSGILMTLGADTAPPGQRAQFLGIWRLFADTGGAAGPLVVSAGAALGSLAAGIVAMGVLSAGVIGALGRWVPRWSVHANARTRREAGVER
ncbi:MFS transporter [Pseudactinotalea sp. Z1748]|uniref:MFS transporter n=1 Tax=Pseudactinotalea sp. Z1748 TaxID=3413027 RepID=UPI003C7EB5F3